MRLLRISALALPWIVLLVVALLLSPLGPFSTTVENARVQCVIDGEIVFDQRVDIATINPFGSITVWIGDNSAVIDGPDCRVIQS